MEERWLGLAVVREEMVVWGGWQWRRWRRVGGAKWLGGLEKKKEEGCAGVEER